MAGVSFMDGREKYLPYNILCIFSPIMLKKKILKYSQALGPFNGIFNKLLSKIFLPKISTIIARGNVTYNYLKELGLRNIILGADSAFLLPVSNVNLSVELVKGFIGISPSGVVATKKKDYADIMADFIKYLINKGKKIVLIPHSVRFGSKRAKNNDILVCSYINEMVSNESCIFLNKDLSSKELRILIGSLDFHVTSRFHAMISSLERGVPTIVIGWSHKYKEVMEMFEVTDYCLDYKELTFDLLKTKFEKLMQSRTFIAKKLTDNLLKVKLSSDVNFEQIKKLLDL
jgi:polysaccharide pyruvyl transferase WcaK-like protein